jgi:hypothetical protein
MLDDRSQAYRDMFTQFLAKQNKQNGTTTVPSGSHDSGSGLQQ